VAVPLVLMLVTVSVLVAAPLVTVIMTGDPGARGEDVSNAHSDSPLINFDGGSPGISPDTHQKLAACRDLFICRQATGNP
jgi:hypothetical protein